ncbi:hypothetical protein [Nonomuraea sp. NEAU-A123]|uniref:hypothetical protein n=1 Tax=Nonomuraea sp. NEAU-A123 TaxID=2839649 RepID=UPI001BE3E73A|nr:hypothetical protein [Nonomuraea sp. NEAU-A123]MBT2227762.1 hypothetical protein [Nonomuraea sp. NEAU-A123]
MSRARTVGLTGLASAMLALSVPAPATAADQARLGDVQQAIRNLAKTAGVVGAIGEVYVDGKRVAQGTAASCRGWPNTTTWIGPARSPCSS